MTVLCAVAVNYFGSSVVPGLVESFAGQNIDDWRLVIVDNSESPAEADRLREITRGDPRVEVVVSPGNIGYLHAAHWWWTAAGGDADWMAVCNTDLVLDGPSFLSTLADLPHDFAVLAPAITALPSGRRQNPYMLRRPTRLRMLVRRLALSSRFTSAVAIKASSRRVSPERRSDDEKVREIYAPHGSFMLFHQSYFERGGDLDHGAFLFGEEITVAERVRSLGLRVGFEPKLSVLHTEHQATGSRSRRVFKAQRDAAKYCYRLIANS